MPTPPGFAECSYALTQTGLVRPAYITFGVDPTSTDPATIAGALATAWASAGSLNSIMDNSVTMTAVRVSLGTDGSGDLVYVLSATVTGGGGTIGSLPPNCAVLFHKATARGGRRGRGRMYLPWSIADSSVDDVGVINSTNVTAHTAAASAWQAALSAGGNPLVLLHAPGKTATPPPDPVTSMTADRLIATQRRRIGR